MIRVYPSSVTDFASGGIALLPSSCIVTEEANGAYTLTLEMSRDEARRTHELLSVHNVICAPVSAKKSPMKHVLKTRGTVSIYIAKGVRTTKHVITNKYFDEVTGELHLEYDTVTTYSTIPMYSDDVFTKLIASLSNGQELTLINTVTGGIFCMSKNGTVGYVKSGSCYYSREADGDVVTVVSDGTFANTVQPFRIKKIEKNAPNSITVQAEHVYFDAMALDLPKASYTNVDPVTVMDAINENGRIEYTCGVTGYITADYDGDNAVSIAADICERLDAQLVRDGFSACLLPAETDDAENEIEIKAGKNIVSLSAAEDIEGLVTRVIPSINNTDGTAIDSPHINDYPMVYATRISAESQAAAETKAAEMWKNGDDVPALTVEVECVPGSIDKASIFDTAHVVDSDLGIDVTGRITSIIYDALNRHVTGVKIGKTIQRIKTSIFSGTTGSWQTTE